MHFVRIIPALILAAVSLLYSAKVLGDISLDQVMSKEEMEKTGVNKLSDAQKKELESWINNKFALKTPPSANKWIYLSENLNNGSQLRLSDGSLYDIAPQDQQHTALWLTPFSVVLTDSGDKDYPVKITNTVTGMSVKAKQAEPPKS